MHHRHNTGHHSRNRTSPTAASPVRTPKSHTVFPQQQPRTEPNENAIHGIPPTYAHSRNYTQNQPNNHQRNQTSTTARYHRREHTKIPPHNRQHHQKTTTNSTEISICHQTSTNVHHETTVLLTSLPTPDRRNHSMGHR